MATIAPPSPTTTAFPTALVEACLVAELTEAVGAFARIKGTPLPATPAQIRIMPVQIDSIVCVDILCAVEPVLGGIELPETVVKAGGYGSIDSAVKNMLPRIEKEWKKRNGVTP